VDSAGERAAVLGVVYLGFVFVAAGCAGEELPPMLGDAAQAEEQQGTAVAPLEEPEPLGTAPGDELAQTAEVLPEPTQSVEAISAGTATQHLTPPVAQPAAETSARPIAADTAEAAQVAPEATPELVGAIPEAEIMAAEVAAEPLGAAPEAAAIESVQHPATVAAEAANVEAAAEPIEPAAEAAPKLVEAIPKQQSRRWCRWRPWLLPYMWKPQRSRMRLRPSLRLSLQPSPCSRSRSCRG